MDWLDVHDVGVYLPNGEPRLFEHGMCLTIEPGLYFGAWRPDVDCPEKYSNIGIRIEDDILITDGGPVVLTDMCPKTIDEIESVVGTSQLGGEYELAILYSSDSRLVDKEKANEYRLSIDEATELYSNAPLHELTMAADMRETFFTKRKSDISCG